MAIVYQASGAASNSATSNSATISATVPVGGYALNSLIVVWAMNGESGAGTPTCVDSAGNSYFLVYNERQSNIRQVLFWSLTQIALTAGQTITVTFPFNNNRRAIRVERFTGSTRVLANVLDTYISNHTTSLTPSSGFTPATSARMDSLVLGGIAHVEPTVGAFTEDVADGWTDLGETRVGTSSIKTLQPFYKIVTTQDVYRMRGTLVSSVLWTAGVAVLKSGEERFVLSFQPEVQVTPVVSSDQAPVGASRIAVLERANVATTDTITELVLDFDVPQGDHIIVTAHYRYHTLATSISDAAGNTWQTDLDVAPLAGTSPRLLVFSSRISNALTAGQVITISTAGQLSTSRTVIAEQWRGLLPSSWLDKTASASNVLSQNPATGLTAATLNEQEVVFGVLAIQGPQSIAIDPAGSFVESAEQRAATRNLQTQYHTVPASGTWFSEWSTDSAQMWVAGVLTYRVGAAAVPQKNFATTISGSISMETGQVPIDKLFSASFSVDSAKLASVGRSTPIEAVSMQVDTDLDAVISTTTSTGLAASMQAETVFDAVISTDTGSIPASMQANTSLDVAIQVIPGFTGNTFLTAHLTLVGSNDISEFIHDAIVGVPRARVRMRAYNVVTIETEQVTPVQFAATVQMRGRQPFIGVGIAVEKGRWTMRGYDVTSRIWTPSEEEQEPVWVPEEVLNAV